VTLNLTAHKGKRLMGLKLTDVSLVDKAANQYAKVLLAKRHKEDTAMPTTVDVRKNAARAFASMTATLAAKCNISLRKAQDAILATENGMRLFQIAKERPPTGFKPDNLPTPEEYQDESGRVVSRTRDARHGEGHPDPFQPYNNTLNPATADATLQRLRDQHSRKVAASFFGAVKAKVNAGMSHSEATEHALREHPEMKNVNGLQAHAAREGYVNQPVTGM
jgi:hypothetical protein